MRSSFRSSDLSAVVKLGLWCDRVPLVGAGGDAWTRFLFISAGRFITRGTSELQIAGALTLNCYSSCSIKTPNRQRWAPEPPAAGGDPAAQRHGPSTLWCSSQSAPCQRRFCSSLTSLRRGLFTPQPPVSCWVDFSCVIREMIVIVLENALMRLLRRMSDSLTCSHTSTEIFRYPFLRCLPGSVVARFSPFLPLCLQTLPQILSSPTGKEESPKEAPSLLPVSAVTT